MSKIYTPEAAAGAMDDLESFVDGLAGHRKRALCLRAVAESMEGATLATVVLDGPYAGRTQLGIDDISLISAALMKEAKRLERRVVDSVERALT